MVAALPAVLLLVSACASGVTRPSDMASLQPALIGAQQAGEVTIALAPEARSAAASSTTFKQEALLAVVRQALEAKNELTRDKDPSLPIVEITVTSVRTRSTFNAIMFGFMAGDDHINGDVVVRSPSGVVLQRFSVSASYALGGFGGGRNEARMSWLYDTFANHLVEELTGTPSG
ncbi:MAG: DUF4410 domain-containing protein [Rhodospirillales bacterium]|nr:DUF4410 domain-containing protein [Rhodospirillales bacterium]